MTITIPDNLIIAIVNAGIFLMCLAVVIVVLAMIGGYFYSKEMNKVNSSTPRRTRKPKNG